MPATDTPPESQDPQPPFLVHRRQLAIQFSAVFLVFSLAWPYYLIRGETLPWLEVSLAIGGIGLLIACLTQQPWWWRLIHAFFAPCAYLLSLLAIPPGWYLLAFILLLLLYRGALSGQIPLFLSNTKTCSAIAALLADRTHARILDLGAGTASVVRHLGQNLRNAEITGTENALIPWLIGYLRTRGFANIHWLMRDFWQIPLAEYDAVYAFLSPAPMPHLWEKIQREMRPGSLFVSNSFPVPDQEPSFLIEVDDARKTLLFCYEIGHS